MQNHELQDPTQDNIELVKIHKLSKLSRIRRSIPLQGTLKNNHHISRQTLELQTRPVPKLKCLPLAQQITNLSINPSNTVPQPTNKRQETAIFRG